MQSPTIWYPLIDEARKNLPIPKFKNKSYILIKVFKGKHNKFLIWVDELDNGGDKIERQFVLSITQGQLFSIFPDYSEITYFKYKKDYTISQLMLEEALLEM